MEEVRWDNMRKSVGKSCARLCNPGYVCVINLLSCSSCFVCFLAIDRDRYGGYVLEE